MIPAIASLAQHQNGFSKLQDERIAIADSEVFDILQDQFGFMWFGTSDGLIRYDGHEMKVYRENPLDTNSLRDNYIRKLLEDNNGNLWVGTAQGNLCRYNRLSDNFTSIPAGPDAKLANRVWDIILSSQNRLWVATNLGLELVDQRTLKREQYFKEGHQLYNFLINCLLEDQHGNIWMGTGGNGLHFLNPSTGQALKLDRDLIASAEDMNDPIYDLVLTEDGKIWVANNTHRLSCIDLGNETFSSHSIAKANGTKIEGIWKIEAADDESLWLGTRDQGLIHYTYTTQSSTVYPHDPTKRGSISSNFIGSLLKTSEALWVGHIGKGVSQFYLGNSGIEQVPFQTVAKNGTSFRRILKDRNGHFWAATHRNGVYRYDPDKGITNQFVHEPGTPNSLAHYLIWDILIDHQGLLWIATHEGLQSFDTQKERFITYEIKPGLQPLAIRTLIEDNEENLWIGTFSGLYCLDASTKQFRHIELSQENSSFIVSKLFVDSQDYLWVSVYGMGVYRVNLETEKITYFQKNPTDFRSLSSNMVGAFAEDDQQKIWLGARGGGLNLFIPEMASDSGHFQHWRPYNSGLTDDNVWDIYSDNNQHLWLNTGSGLFTFNTENQKITSYQLPGIPERFSFAAQAGVPGKLFLWDNTDHLAYQFTPNELSQNEEIPQVFITGLQVTGQDALPKDHFDADAFGLPILEKTILFTESVDLSYWQNDLTFQFSTLNFIQPERNQYKFKLEGYDPDWIETDAWNRHIRYTNLSPGEYNFKVIASNNDGLWNETGKTLAIHISPPWWHTWWAYVIYSILLFLTIRAIYNFQLNRKLIEAEAKRLKELDTAKTRLFTNVTHEFRTPLTVILGMARKVKEDPKEWLFEGIDSIQRSGRQLLELVNQMLDLSRLESNNLQLDYRQGDVVAYLGYLVQSYQSYAVSKQIDLQWNSAITEVVMDYAPGALAKIMGNLLSNAMKYTPGGGIISVNLNLRDSGKLKNLLLTIQDTGIGIPEDQLPHIFDRFYQIEQAQSLNGRRNGSSYQTGGTGIGLALVKELVALMDGHVTVESTIKRGTTFQIMLPIRNTAAVVNPWEPVIPHTRIQEVQRKKTASKWTDEQLPIALIIEDNPDVTRYVESCLQKQYTIHTAVNGKIGVEKALDIIPDIIICDVMMPEMDGYQVCHTLKNNERSSHIPIVMLTAKVDQYSRLVGLRRGADAYLAKPFDPEELELQLNNLLQLSQKVRQHLANFPRTNDEPAQLFPQENAFLQRLKSIVLANISDDAFGITEVCAALAISRSQLHRKLKAITGKSTSLIIRSIRLEEAHLRLLDSELTIAEIAYQVGFNNPNYFSTVFSETYGMSPTEMRENQALQQ